MPKMPSNFRLNSVPAEMANMRDDMHHSMRDEIRALSTTGLRMDSSVQSMAQDLGAISGSLAEQ
jgi:precorrin-6B methylase 2